ncbi:unnamed protein product [Dicrocoelium dendriticum]|nr:unnamed protein product [Dicrocoelium dendriticum]
MLTTFWLPFIAAHLCLHRVCLVRHESATFSLHVFSLIIPNPSKKYVGIIANTVEELDVVGLHALGTSQLIQGKRIARILARQTYQSITKQFACFTLGIDVLLSHSSSIRERKSASSQRLLTTSTQSLRAICVRPTVLQ